MDLWTIPHHGLTLWTCSAGLWTSVLCSGAHHGSRILRMISASLPTGLSNARFRSCRSCLFAQHNMQEASPTIYPCGFYDLTQPGRTFGTSSLMGKGCQSLRLHTIDTLPYPVDYNLILTVNVLAFNGRVSHKAASLRQFTDQLRRPLTIRKNVVAFDPAAV